MARSLPRAAIAAAVLLMLLAAPALGHAAFVSGTPGPGDEVVGTPAQLVIEFSQDLDPSRTSLEVRDTSGASLARGGELGDGPREFRLALPELAPGEYEVRWTSFSAEDGELARDSYTFTMVAAPSPSPSPSPSQIPSLSPPPSPTPLPATPAPSPSVVEPADEAPASGDGVVMLPILAASLVVSCMAVWLLRRRAA
ncbi:MAG: copper resistance CopC family protein [Candidatus Limnocylindrales bacterium]